MTELPLVLGDFEARAPATCWHPGRCPTTRAAPARRSPCAGFSSRRVLELLLEDLDRSLALVGAPSLRDLDEGFLAR